MYSIDENMPVSTQNHSGQEYSNANAYLFYEYIYFQSSCSLSILGIFKHKHSYISRLKSHTMGLTL